MNGSGESLDIVRVKLVLDRRLYSEQLLNDPKSVYEVMKQELMEYDREVFCILNMNANGRCINMNIASMGGLDYALIEPREVFKSAILSNSHHIIVVHNHPSGSTKPSKEDIRITERLIECGKLLGIPVCDHIIVGGGTGELYSFVDHGMIKAGNAGQTVREPEIEEKQNRKQR